MIVSKFLGTVFAYGQTSSGKTYTIMGCDEQWGVIPYSVAEIFDTIENVNKFYRLINKKLKILFDFSFRHQIANFYFVFRTWKFITKQLPIF